MADIMEKFWSAPPVSRTLVAAMLVESALIHSGLVHWSKAAFFSPALFKLPPQAWRLLSSFLLTGGGFSFVIDLYFSMTKIFSSQTQLTFLLVWTYSSGLELNSSRFTQPGDFFTYVLFVASVILGTAGFVLGSWFFTSSLLLAFIYTFAQDNRGQKAHFVIFQIPVELLPWAMLPLTLVMGGPSAALEQSMGVVAAHSYDFLTRLYPTFQGGKNYIRTPAAIRRVFASQTTTYTSRAYGTAVRPGQPTQRTTSSGWTSGYSSSSWRGTGRRLGGD